MNKISKAFKSLVGRFKERPLHLLVWVVGVAAVMSIIALIVWLLANFGGYLIAAIFALMAVFLVGYKLFQGFPAIFGASVQVIAAAMIFAGILLISYANQNGSEIAMDVVVLDQLLREKMGFSSEMAQGVAQLAGTFSSMGMIVFSIIVICVGLFVGLMGELVSATAGMVIYGQTISDKLGKLDNLDRLKCLTDLSNINSSTQIVSEEINRLRNQIGDLTQEIERLKEDRLTEFN